VETSEANAGVVPGRTISGAVKRQPLAAVGIALLALFVVCALFAPWLAPQDPAQLDLTGRLMGPSAAHWFGTDELGRDILSRTLFGARISLIVAVSVVGLSLAVGLVAGGLAGFYGGWTDTVVNIYVTNAFLALPGILLAIAFVAFMGPGLGNVILALAGVCAAGASAGDGGEGTRVCGGGAGARSERSARDDAAHSSEYSAAADCAGGDRHGWSGVSGGYVELPGVGCSAAGG